MSEKGGVSFAKGCLMVVGGIVLFVAVLGTGICMCAVAVPNFNEAQERARVSRETVSPTPVSDITWEEIEAVYSLQSEATDLQKDEKWKMYKGKKVKWTGTVTSVSDTFGTLSLQAKLNPQTFISDVIVSLEESERSKAVTLTEGDSVTFEGILKSWGTLTAISINHGKIVE